MSYKFTGKERDTESNLDNFGARFDFSSIGRFMSPDPLMASATVRDPQTWNRYAYALNNPLRFIDPDGMKEVSAEDCKKDANCVTVKVNVIYDQNANGGKGLTDNQKKAFDSQLQNAKDQYGNADIHFDVTYATGGTDANGNIQGLVKDSTNEIVSDSTPTGDAGVSQVDKRGLCPDRNRHNKIRSRNPIARTRPSVHWRYDRPSQRSLLRRSNRNSKQDRQRAIRHGQRYTARPTKRRTTAEHSKTVHAVQRL